MIQNGDKSVYLVHSNSADSTHNLACIIARPMKEIVSLSSHVQHIIIFPSVSSQSFKAIKIHNNS